MTADDTRTDPIDTLARIIHDCEVPPPSNSEWPSDDADVYRGMIDALLSPENAPTVIGALAAAGHLRRIEEHDSEGSWHYGTESWCSR